MRDVSDQRFISRATGRDPTSLANDAWIALILIDVCGDVLPQLLEHERAPSEMQRSKVAMRDCLRDNLWGRAWHKLYNSGRHASLGEDLVNEVVGIRRCGRGLPNDDVANEGGCYRP